MRQSKLPKGIYAAALTPLNADLSCNHELLADHCFDLIQRGCQGIALFGTTGEGPSFSVLEKIEGLKRLIRAGLDPAKIILGNGSSNLEDTASLARAALKHGCAALLAAPPSFFKNISDEGVVAFYSQVIQRSAPELKLILYHIPQYSGVPISLHAIQKLLEEFPETVIGLKESEGNFSLTQQALKAFPGFQVFVGKEAHIPEAISLGGAGSICGLANLYPEWISELYKQEHGRQETHLQDLSHFHEILKGLPYIPAAKAIMQKRKGDAWARVRPPLTPLPEAQSQSLIDQLDKAGLEKT